MLGGAGGVLRPPETLAVGDVRPATGALVVADFTGDGLPDIAVNGVWLRQRAVAVGASATPTRVTQMATAAPASSAGLAASSLGPGLGWTTRGLHFGKLLRSAKPPAGQ